MVSAHIINPSLVSFMITQGESYQPVIMGLQYDKKASAKRCLADSWSRILFHCRLATTEAVTIDAILSAASTHARDIMMDQGDEETMEGKNELNGDSNPTMMMSS